MMQYSYKKEIKLVQLEQNSMPETCNPCLLASHLSDIKIEVEIMKVKSWRTNDQETLEHLSKIDRAISGITDELLELRVNEEKLTN